MSKNKMGLKMGLTVTRGNFMRAIHFLFELVFRYIQPFLVTSSPNIKFPFLLLEKIKIIGFVAILFVGIQSKSAQILNAKWNQMTQKIELKVAFTGGLQEHQFSLDWDSCQFFPKIGDLKQVAARLIDSGWEDTGYEQFIQNLEFDLEDPTCRPSQVTVISGKFSRKTFYIK